MAQELDLMLSPEESVNNDHIVKKIIAKTGASLDIAQNFELIKRSIDARSKTPKVRLRVRLLSPGEKDTSAKWNSEYQDVSNKEEILIVGAGPAGLFAALRLIELGKKPVILERGKDVRRRRRDLAAINKDHVVNPESNYCFGEGGAGTYSDGKLYTRSKKRGDVQRILDVLLNHGANEAIKIDAHPHIGTNKLPEIITNMRQTILDHGGEIHFDSKVTDFIFEGNQFRGCVVGEHTSIKARKCILATGHSARDIFELLNEKGVEMEAKPYAIGVRIEHQQQLIDQIQYNCEVRSSYLPPASYSLVHQVEQRGVYSFCMCPGGIIAPCATQQEEVVTNGWSPSKRDQSTANSGIVVSLNLQDFENDSPLAGMRFQQSIEKTAWELAGKSQKVPAQRMVDFINGKTSTNIPKTSYFPGTTSIDLVEVFPSFIHKSLKRAFEHFGSKMKGYLTNEAILHAPESRTSSPVRIPRDRESLEHIRIRGLYPCGEGAGYAGGIVSAAIDGEKCAEKCAEK